HITTLAARRSLCCAACLPGQHRTTQRRPGRLQPNLVRPVPGECGRVGAGVCHARSRKNGSAGQPPGQPPARVWLCGCPLPGNRVAGNHCGPRSEGTSTNSRFAAFLESRLWFCTEWQQSHSAGRALCQVEGTGIGGSYPPEGMWCVGNGCDWVTSLKLLRFYARG